MEGDRQPVANDNQADRSGAQKVDVAVALRRRLRGDAGGPGPEEDLYDALLLKTTAAGGDAPVYSARGWSA